MLKKIKNRFKSKKFAPPPPVAVTPTATPIAAPSIAQVSGNGSVTTEESDSASGESLEGRMQLQVVLPDGATVTEAVERRTPMGDLLVQLTKPRKLSPSNHILNVNAEKDSVSYKPNTAIGSLNATVVYVTAKNPVKRNSNSKLPFETTFRITVHLPHGQLHVLRLSPNVPLNAVLNAVCQERGLAESRYELRHPVYTEERLDYKRSLSDYNLTEVALVAIKSAAPVPVVTSSDIMAMKARKTSDTGSSRGDSPVRSEASSKRSTSPGRPSRPGKPPAPRKRLAPAPPPTSQPLKTPPETDPDPITTPTGGTVTSGSHSRHSSDSSGYHEASILSDSTEAPTPTPVIVTSSSSSSVTSVVSVAKKRQAPGPPKPAPRSNVPLRAPDPKPREAPEQPEPDVVSPPVKEIEDVTMGKSSPSPRVSISSSSSSEEEVVERNCESKMADEEEGTVEMKEAVVTKVEDLKEEDERNATGFSLGEEDVGDGGAKQIDGVVENETADLPDGGVESANVGETFPEDVASRRSSSSLSSRSSKGSGEITSVPAEILALDLAITEDTVTEDITTEEKTIAWEYQLPDPPVPPVLPNTPPPHPPPPPPVLPEDPPQAPPPVPPSVPPPAVPPEDPPQPHPSNSPEVPPQPPPSVPSKEPPQTPPPALPSVPPPPLTPVDPEPPLRSSEDIFKRNEAKDAVVESPIVPVVAKPVEVQVVNGEEDPKIQKVVTRTQVAARRGPLVNFSIATYKSRSSDGYQYDTPDSPRSESIAEKSKRFSVRTDYEKVEVVPDKKEEVIEKVDAVPDQAPKTDDGVSETEAQAKLQKEYNKLQQQMLEWQKQIMRNQAILQEQHAAPPSSAESIRQMQEHMSQLQKQVTVHIKGMVSSTVEPKKEVTEEELRTRSLPRPTNPSTLSVAQTGAATLGRRPGAVRVSVNSWNGRQSAVETPMESSRIVPLRTRKDTAETKTVEEVIPRVDDRVSKEPDVNSEVKVAVVDAVSSVVLRRKELKEHDTTIKPQPASANVLVTSTARPISYAGSSTEAANFSAAFGKPTNKRFTTLVNLMAAQALSNVPKSGPTPDVPASTRLETKTKPMEPATRKEVSSSGTSLQPPPQPPPPPPPPPPQPSDEVDAPVMRAEMPSRKLVITGNNRHSNGESSGDQRQELLSAIGSFGGRSGLKKVPNNEVKSWQMRHGSLDSFA